MTSLGKALAALERTQVLESDWADLTSLLNKTCDFRYITYFLIPHSVSVQEHNHHYFKGLSQGLNISHRKTRHKYKINIKYYLPATYTVPLNFMLLPCCIGFHFSFN